MCVAVCLVHHKLVKVPKKHCVAHDVTAIVATEYYFAGSVIAARSTTQASAVLARAHGLMLSMYSPGS